MKKLILIIVAITAMIMPEMMSGQSQITRPTKKKTEQTSGNQPSKQKNNSAQTKISVPDGYDNGHGYVDLGLPSGTKWATCNVGGKSPESFGNYYAWGETESRKEYTEDLSQTFNKSISTLESEGVINSDGLLTPTYDAATVHWGESWRSPTKEECEELVKECKWVNYTYKGKAGVRVTGPNNKSIFIPAAGFFADKYGNLHIGSFVSTSSGSVKNDKQCKWYMYFSYSKPGISSGRRSCGEPIRAVYIK